MSWENETKQQMKHINCNTVFNSACSYISVFVTTIDINEVSLYTFLVNVFTADIVCFEWLNADLAIVVAVDDWRIIVESREWVNRREEMIQKKKTDDVMNRIVGWTVIMNRWQQAKREISSLSWMRL